MKAGVVRLDVDCGVVFGDRLVQPMLCVQGVAKAEMRIRVVGLLANGIQVGNRGSLQDRRRFLVAAFDL